MSNVDLHVAAADLAAKTKEAAGLTKLNIDKMSTQWLQVNATAHTCASDIHATTSSPIIPVAPFTQNAGGGSHSGSQHVGSD